MNNSKKVKSVKKAVIYTRVSTEDQAARGYSLIDQEEILRKACAQDKVDIVEHFQDDGYSAKNFRRPGFQRMLGMLKSGQLVIDLFYVVKWDRFSRNIEESYIMIKELRSLGVKVRCLEEILDSSDPAFGLIRAFKIAEPEVDNLRRAKNTQMGIRRALKEGRYACGAAPTGYSWDRSGIRPMIKPNESACLVREAFELYATGLYSIEGVRKLVQDRGLNIQKTAFNRMLRNPIYKGNIVVPELEGEEEEQLVIGIHEAIVSKELFDKVQGVLARILEKNASRVEKINYRDELPLRGLLQCPTCHSSWTGSGSRGNGGTYFYYHCQNGCKERAKAEEANSLFSDYLKSFQVYPEVSNLYMAIIEDIFKTKEGDREKEIDRFQKTLAELEPKLLKIDEMFVTGDLEKDSYQLL